MATHTGSHFHMREKIMSFKNTSTLLQADWRTNESISLPYPQGANGTNLKSTGHEIATTQGSLFKSDNGDFEVSFGGSDVSVINRTGRTIASGNVIYLALATVGDTNSETAQPSANVVAYQSSATYLLSAQDNGYTLIYNGQAAGVWTMPSGLSLGSNFGLYIENRSANRLPMKITPASGTINGRANLVIPFGAGAYLSSDGTGDLVASYSLGLNGRLTVLKTSVPMVLPPNGTVTNTVGGASIALSGTGLDATLEDGCYMYLPQNGAFAGSAAGFYYVVMSSRTAGTVYSNYWDNATAVGAPTIPANPSNITSVRGATAYTTPNGQVVMARQTLQGGLMGRTGRLQTMMFFTFSNSNQQKQLLVDLGGFSYHSTSPTTQTAASMHGGFSNVGRADRQKTMHLNFGAGGFQQGIYTPERGTVNTDNDLTHEVRGNIAAGGTTDFIILHSAVSEVVL